MNTNEAIKILKRNKPTSDPRKCGVELCEAVDMAISALEKQIPKKVIIKTWNPAICPTCGEELSEDLGDGYYEHYRYLERCPNVECAQRLLW